MCILLVEDNEVLCETFKEFLMSEGFSVYEAQTLEEAVDLIEHPPEEFTLLITDVNISGNLNGFDIGRLMRQGCSLLPIIYITGKLDNVEALDLKEVLLLKPFSLRKLLLTVQEFFMDCQYVG